MDIKLIELLGTEFLTSVGSDKEHLQLIEMVGGGGGWLRAIGAFTIHSYDRIEMLLSFKPIKRFI